MHWGRVVMVVGVLQALGEAAGVWGPYQFCGHLEPGQPGNAHSFEQHAEEPEMDLHAGEDTISNVSKGKTVRLSSHYIFRGLPVGEELVPG